jgi:glycosyltransferase involved in cell wall biosynthesis
VVCLWTGGQPGTPAFDALQQQAKHSEFAAQIQVLPAVSDPHKYLAIYDVLLIPSREECMPLVLLEAATIAKPVVAFDATGGGAAFIHQSGADTLVPYEDIDAFATKSVELLNHEDRRKEAGHKMQAFLHREYDQRQSIADFMKAMEACMLQPLKQQTADQNYRKIDNQ